MSLITQESFRTSVNIKYDIGNQTFLSRYLPTPSHAESIIKISEGFIDKDANASHIMIGPYGSGKSLLATVIANIVSKKVDQKSVQKLINKFNNVHQDVLESLDSLAKLDRRYIPIILNGSYYNFGEKLIEEIQEGLISEGINIFLPTEKNNIRKIIDNWKENFPDTYENFINKINNTFNNYDLWISKINSGNRTAIKWFKEIYPELTSGAIYHDDNDGNFLKNLDLILSVLKQNNIGLLLIHDEFGRFLQNLDQTRIYKSMQELQDIAEFVNRSNGLMHILLISHRNMSQYMKGFHADFQAEFKRIEKRYATYFVESDSATYYRIVHQLMSNKYHFEQKSVQKELLTKLKGFNLFPELNHHEIDNLIAHGCQPIHPVTLYLLPRISKVFGQNERTLFTYLESEDPYGFKEYIKKYNGYIYADTLFLYFFSESDFENIYDEKTKSVIRTYQLIRSNLDARKKNAYCVIRFMTLWQLTNSNRVYNLDIELISFATGLDVNKVKEILEELTRLKFVRYNRIYKRWELSEGSSIVIEELINEKKLETTINYKSRVNVITNLFPKKYYLARDYNEEKSMTRFMKGQFFISSKFIKENFNDEELLLSNSDGTINYIILEKLEDYLKVTNKIKEINNKRLIFAVLKNEFINIKDTIDNYLIVNELLNDQSLLSEYKNLKNELNLYKEDYKYEIISFLRSFIEFNNNVDWYYDGQSILLNNEIELEEFLSTIMWGLFPKTPLVMNDSINRYNVIGIQERSLIEVIDRVLTSHYKENLGIEGHGPNYLIFATVLKNNGIDLRKLNKIECQFTRELRDDLIQYIENNKESTLKELYKIVSKEPYGIRPPLVPLFIVICLRDKWDQLMFYHNNMFVPALEGEKLYEMFKSPESYNYVYYDYSTDMQEFLNILERRFEEHISEYVEDEIQVIRVSSGLLNWLRSLPRQTQITEQFLSQEAIKLKELIRKSEVNPLKSLQEIYISFNSDVELLPNLINELENAHELFKEEVEVQFCRKLEINKFNKKDTFINKWNEKNTTLKSNLINILLNAKTFEEFVFNYIGTELHNWSDINYSLFIKQIENDLSTLETENIDDENTIQITLNNEHKLIRKVELSKKAEVIYNNLNRILTNAGRNVPSNEINFIIVKLINEFIK